MERANETMKTICAWCGVPLKIDLKKNNLISHGICPTCRDGIRAGLNSQKINEFLDSFETPVLAVDGDAVILGGNKKAQVVLEKESYQIHQQRGGNAMSCVHSLLPEGCGRTEHCKFCTVRNCIQETFNTGKGQLQVTAPMKILVDGNPVDIRMRISTEKVDDIVLLRIDEMQFA